VPRARSASVGAHRDCRDDQLVSSARCGRKGRGIDLAERSLGLVQAPDQEQASDLEIPRVGGIHQVAMRCKRRTGCRERLPGRAQIARHERDLGLGDNASGARHGLLRAERTRGTSQQRLRPDEITELRHRDAADRQRRRVTAQCDPLQRTQRIADRQRACRRIDQ